MKINKFISLLIIVTFFLFDQKQIFAQNVSEKKEKIDLQLTTSSLGGHSFSYKKVSNIHYKPIGTYGQFLKPHLASNPEALKQVERYQVKRICSSIIGVGSIIYAGVWIGSGAVDENKKPILYISACLFTSVGLSLASKRNILKAVSIYNADLDKTSDTMRNYQFIPDKIGIGYNNVIDKLMIKMVWTIN